MDAIPLLGLPSLDGVGGRSSGAEPQLLELTLFQPPGDLDEEEQRRQTDRLP